MNLITRGIIWNKNRCFRATKKETRGTDMDLILCYEALDAESQWLGLSQKLENPPCCVRDPHAFSTTERSTWQMGRGMGTGKQPSDLPASLCAAPMVKNYRIHRMHIESKFTLHWVTNRLSSNKLQRVKTQNMLSHTVIWTRGSKITRVRK